MTDRDVTNFNVPTQVTLGARCARSGWPLRRNLCELVLASQSEARGIIDNQDGAQRDPSPPSRGEPVVDL